MFRMRTIYVFLVLILLAPSGRGKTIVPRAASSEDLRAGTSDAEKKWPVSMEKDKELSSARRIPSFGQPDLSGNVPVDALDDSFVHKPAPDYDFREPVDVDYRRESDFAGKPNGFLPGDDFDNDAGKADGPNNKHFNEGKFPEREKEEDDKREEEEEESVAYEDNDGEPNDKDKGTGEERDISKDEDNEDGKRGIGGKDVTSHKDDEEKKDEDDETNKKDFGEEHSTSLYDDKEKSNKDNEGDKKYVEEKDSSSHDDDEEKGNEDNEDEKKDVGVENSTSHEDDVGKGENGHDEVVTGVEKEPDEYEDEIPSAHDLFDTPFFNLRQVSKYFQQLEKAMEHMFRKTMEEASFLNGTLTNTTEEDVNINGKPYRVLKSLMKSPDSNSSLYVETLSPKSNETDVSQE